MFVQLLHVCLFSMKTKKINIKLPSFILLFRAEDQNQPNKTQRFRQADIFLTVKLLVRFSSNTNNIEHITIAVVLDHLTTDLGNVLHSFQSSKFCNTSCF